VAARWSLRWNLIRLERNGSWAPLALILDPMDAD